MTKEAMFENKNYNHTTVKTNHQTPLKPFAQSTHPESTAPASAAAASIRHL